MNPEWDNQTEAQIDRLLKDLPDLAAPADLISRTMKRIARPAVPWHGRPWAAWPAGLRAAYLVLTLGALAGAFSTWRALGPRLFGTMVARFAHWRAAVECLSDALGTLAGALALVPDHFGKGVMVSCALVVVLAYAACVGFGTVFVRLALSRSRKG